MITRRVAEQQEAAGEATAMSADLIAGLRPLRGIGAERAASARYPQGQQGGDDRQCPGCPHPRVYLGFSTSLSALLAVGIAVLAGLVRAARRYHGRSAHHRHRTSPVLLEPFSTMAEVPSWIAEAQASAEQVGWIEDARFALSPGTAALGPGPHGVVLDGVRHGSLQDITLAVEAGQLVAVVATRLSDAEAMITVLSGQLARAEYSGEIRLGDSAVGKISHSGRPAARCWWNRTGPTCSPVRCAAI